MNPNLFDTVLARLRARRPNWREVSRGSGVPYETLKKIARGTTPNPGVMHVQRLADYFEAQGRTPAPEAAEVTHAQA